MPRPSSPPQGFICAYMHNCPHLDELSTKWVLGEYRRAGDVYQEHLRIMDVFQSELISARKRIRDIERENAELSAKLTALHRRQFKPNKKQPDDKARAKDAASEHEGIKKKKRGAPVGHPGWYRQKPAHIDKTINVAAPEICPHCREKNLVLTKETHEHLQEDIVLQPRTVVTRYLHQEAYCGRCKRSVIQAGKDEMLHAPIGPIAKSAAVYLRYQIGIPYRKTMDILSGLFGLTCVPASILGFDRKAAKKGAPVYEDLLEKIRVSDMLHADETSWRNDGVNHYVWFSGNENMAFFHIDRHRSASVAKGLFGPAFNGILVRDRYAAYNGIGRDWQSCLAHIIRRAKEIKQEHELLPDAKKDSDVVVFCEGVSNLLSTACKMGNQLLKGVLPWDKAAQLETRFTKDLNRFCKQQLNFKSAETLRATLVGKDQKRLFTFLRNPGVPPTNNHAEQSLRKMVIFRKICFGTRSEKGLKTHSILPSLVQTSARQGIHTRRFLQTLLTADTATAQALLYRNSS